LATGTITKCVGLVTQFNSLGVVDGALTLANEAVIRRENTVENRRGHKLYGAVTDSPLQTMTYSGTVLSHLRDSTVVYDNGAGTFTAYSGTYDAPSGRKMRFQEANNNLYVTTSAGVKVFGNVTGTAARRAGIPQCLNLGLTITSATGNWLAAGDSVAYRACYVRTDANNNVIRGAPSQFTIVKNPTVTAAARCVTVRVYLHQDITTSDTVEVYRSDDVTGTPTDEMNLLYQVSPSSTDITNKYLEFTDTTSFDVIANAVILYTSPSQGGITQANDEPPLCKDLALYKSNYMFFANTQTKQRLNMTFLGNANVGKKTTGNILITSNTILLVADVTNIETGWKVEGAGIPANTTVVSVVGSTVTISNAATATTAGVDLRFYTHRTVTLAGTTYSFGSSENTATGQVQVDVDSYSAATQVENTALSFVKVINLYATNTTVYAFYVSGPEDLPGQITIEERTLGGSDYTFKGSATSITLAFYPNPPVTPATSTASTSSNDTKTNYVYYSQYGQLEGVPALNFLPIGSSNTVILRIFALRDSLIVVTDKGIYRVIGETAPFSVSAIDLTVYGVAAESWATLANTAIGLSNQGVVGVSDTSVNVISHEIEPNILPLLTISALSTYSVGISYESDRTYLLSTVESSLDTAATQTFVYNAFTKAWTRWTLVMTSGAVLPTNDKLYFSRPDLSNMYQERKDFDDSDYADPEYTVTIVSISGTSVTISVSGSNVPLAGDVLSQAGTGISIESISQSGTNYIAILQLTPPDSWAAGSATIYPAVRLDIQYNGWVGGAPSLLKRMTDFTVLTDTIGSFNTASSVTVNFTTDLEGTEQERTIESSFSAWGSGPWGAFPWGGVQNSGSYNTFTPKKMVYARVWYIRVKHNVALEKLSVVGVGMEYDVVSERVNR